MSFPVKRQFQQFCVSKLGSGTFPDVASNGPWNAKRLRARILTQKCKIVFIKASTSQRWITILVIKCFLTNAFSSYPLYGKGCRGKGHLDASDRLLIWGIKAKSPPSSDRTWLSPVSHVLHDSCGFTTSINIIIILLHHYYGIFTS